MNGFSFRTKGGSGPGGSNGRIKGEIGSTPFSGIGGGGVPSPVTPIPPTSTPPLYNGTPPGEPSNAVPSNGLTYGPGLELNNETVPGTFFELCMWSRSTFNYTITPR